MTDSISAFPLTWPDAIPRSAHRNPSQFKTSIHGAIDNVQGSLRRFSSDTGKALKSIVISSNVTLGMNRPSDPGVAVWFVWDGMQVCIAVDRYAKVEENLQAIHHIIEARRTEMRHGGLAIVRASFRGFLALPAPAQVSWREVLSIRVEHPTREDLKQAFHAAAKIAHPDHGGSNEAMQQVKAAYDQAIKEIGK